MKESALLNYINNNLTSWKETLLAKPYSLIINEEDPYVILKYNQIESDFKIPLVQEARGIILKKREDTTYKIVCRAFDKFFNHGEGNAVDIDEASMEVQEKVDGCCDKDTLLQTDKGYFTIEDIIKDYENYKVLSLNHDSNTQEFVSIEGVSIKDNNNDWYEIELENGLKLILTGNHRVWLPSLQCYRQVRDWIGTEEVLLRKY